MNFIQKIKNIILKNLTGSKKNTTLRNKPEEILKMEKKTSEELLRKKRETIKSFKAKMDLERTWTEKLADSLTKSFGTIQFLIINGIIFLTWITINMGYFPGLSVFDPYPFNFLTMTVSLEAIFLAIIVLISQNRAARIADLREEIDLHINVKAEEEITKILNIVDSIHDHIGLPAEDDEELISMKEKTNLEEIEKELKEEEKYR